jgi:aminoglycoside phosphotransferase (APT) family kinase protein
MAFEFIDTFAELERFDWRAHGLEGFGKPDGFLDRQVDRWLGQLASYDTREIAGIQEVAGWLRDHKPEMGPPSLIHGDYQFRNVMFAYGTPARLVAVIDWELATIGDPLVDLGYLLIRWFEAGEQAPEAPAGTPLLTALPGMPTREELATRYAEVTGRPLDNLAYYQALAQFKLAIIIEARRSRALAEGSESDAAYRPGLLTIETMVDNMVRRAAVIAGVSY